MTTYPEDNNPRGQLPPRTITPRGPLPPRTITPGKLLPGELLPGELPFKDNYPPKNYPPRTITPEDNYLRGQLPSEDNYPPRKITRWQLPPRTTIPGKLLPVELPPEDNYPRGQLPHGQSWFNSKIRFDTLRDGYEPIRSNAWTHIRSNTIARYLPHYYTFPFYYNVCNASAVADFHEACKCLVIDQRFSKCIEIHLYGAALFQPFVSDGFFPQIAKSSQIIILQDSGTRQVLCTHVRGNLRIKNGEDIFKLVTN